MSLVLLSQLLLIVQITLLFLLVSQVLPNELEVALHLLLDLVGLQRDQSCLALGMQNDGLVETPG